MTTQPQRRMYHSHTCVWVLCKPTAVCTGYTVRKKNMFVLLVLAFSLSHTGTHIKSLLRSLSLSVGMASVGMLPVGSVLLSILTLSCLRRWSHLPQGLHFLCTSTCTYGKKQTYSLTHTKRPAYLWWIEYHTTIQYGSITVFACLITVFQKPQCAVGANNLLL